MRRNFTSDYSDKLLVLRLNRKVHRVAANPPPSTASD
jgi:hypothetical protein